MVPMAPPVDIPAGSVLNSALAGGLASALSTSMLHPLDTVKVRFPRLPYFGSVYCSFWQEIGIFKLSILIQLIICTGFPRVGMGFVVCLRNSNSNFGPIFGIEVKDEEYLTQR